MTFDQFIQDWTGKQPLYPPNPREFLGQCYQLFNFYNRDVVGAPDYLAPLAHQIFTNFEGSPLEPFYDKIEYTSGATPQKGDVVIWSKNLPNSGNAGHVGICTISGVIYFESFDSNWGGKQAHLVEHDYSYVLGWLRPKGATMLPSYKEVADLFTQYEIGPLSEKQQNDYVAQDERVLYKDLLQYNYDRRKELARELAKYQSANGDATKWQTLMTLLGLNK